MYVAGIERLTVDYVRAMVAAARGTDAPTTLVTHPDPAILLEGEAGATAAGRFLVENHMDQPISAPVCVSPFTSAQGHTVDVRLQFEPDVVTLQPREQLLVRVGTTIDEQLADADGYWGFLGVPELPGTELAVLVRRNAAPRRERHDAGLQSGAGKGRISKGAPSLFTSTSKPFPKGSP